MLDYEIRSVLEFSSVVYHSLIPKYLANLLEAIQKRTLKSIYGYELNYEELLQRSGLPRLGERRSGAFSKFAKKTSENPKYKHWFPLREQQRQTRSNNPYLEERATGDRLYKSPLFAMRRELNGNTPNHEIDLSGIFNDQ